MWMSDQAVITMERAIEAKFTQHPKLRDKLMETVGSALVECNRYDATWGIGLPIGHPDVTDPLNWKGKNLLGVCLSKVRDTKIVK